MKHTSESRHKICIFQTFSTLLKCQFCLEKLSSFCMTEFVIANSTVLPKGRLEILPCISPAFSWAPGTLTQHTACVCLNPRALPFCLERAGTWEALAERKLSCCLQLKLDAQLSRQSCPRLRKGSRSHFCWPHYPTTSLACLAPT